MGTWIFGFVGSEPYYRLYERGPLPKKRGPGGAHRPLSSSFLGLPYRVLSINHKKELPKGSMYPYSIYLEPKVPL